MHARATLHRGTGHGLKFARFLGPVVTNNVAEYQALLDGLELARTHGVTEIDVLSDSQLVVCASWDGRMSYHPPQSRCWANTG